MKIAKVIPLFKEGNKHLFTNCRSVMLLSQFENILEKNLFSNRQEKLNKYDLNNQSHMEVELHRIIIKAMEAIRTVLNLKQYAVVVFINFKKAFDTVNHSILLNKLQRYDIIGVALSWIRSYLSRIQEFVKLGEFRFGYMEIACGVP